MAFELPTTAALAGDLAPLVEAIVKAADQATETISKAIFEQQRWRVPPIMGELLRRGDLSPQERYRTLNMGIGYTLIVPIAEAEKAVGAVPGAKVVGWIERRGADDPAVVVHPARS